MIYLSQFIFPSIAAEERYLHEIKETCFTTVYPFQVLTEHEVHTLNFDEAVTVLYGGNGSGKTTALNVIAEKLRLERDTLYNRTNFFGDFVGFCDYVLERELPEGSRIITSDDVFDFMLNIRSLNEEIDRKRETVFEDYFDAKYSDFRLRSIDDYEELVKFIEESARFFGCQFIIATHSPFLLSMKNAKIYNLDEEPMQVSKWTELPNVRAYYDFFKQHENEFK